MMTHTVGTSPAIALALIATALMVWASLRKKRLQTRHQDWRCPSCGQYFRKGNCGCTANRRNR